MNIVPLYSEEDVEYKYVKLYYPYYTDHEAVRVIVELK